MPESSPTPSRHRRAWSKDDDSILLWGWGQTHIELLAKQLERTPGALVMRTRKLGLNGRSDADMISLCELARRVGRDTAAVRRVIDQLGISLRLKARVRPRTPRDGKKPLRTARRYNIPLEDAQRVIDVLKPLSGTDILTVKALGAWAVQYACCTRCGKTDSAHESHGVCSRCAAHVRDLAIGRVIPDEYDGYVRLSVLGYEFKKRTFFVRHVATLAGVEVLQGKRVHYVTLEGADKIRVVIASKARISAKPYSAWGVSGRPEVCVRCGKSDKAHRARGLCNACYEWLRRHGEHAV